jgi:hypothetical protein
MPYTEANLQNLLNALGKFIPRAKTLDVTLATWYLDSLTQTKGVHGYLEGTARSVESLFETTGGNQPILESPMLPSRCKVNRVCLAVGHLCSRVGPVCAKSSGFSSDFSFSHWLGDNYCENFTVYMMTGWLDGDAKTVPDLETVSAGRFDVEEGCGPWRVWSSCRRATTTMGTVVVMGGRGRRRSGHGLLWRCR